jgi:hypothetical protein
METTDGGPRPSEGTGLLIPHRQFSFRVVADDKSDRIRLRTEVGSLQGEPPLLLDVLARDRSQAEVDELVDELNTIRVGLAVPVTGELASAERATQDQTGPEPNESDETDEPDEPDEPDGEADLVFVANFWGSEDPPQGASPVLRRPCMVTILSGIRINAGTTHIFRTRRGVVRRGYIIVSAGAASLRKPGSASVTVDASDTGIKPLRGRRLFVTGHASPTLYDFHGRFCRVQ